MSDVENCDALVAKGCDVNLQTVTGDTMLHAAIESGNEASALFLLEKNASATLSNDRRETALHIACYTGNVAVVEMLLEENKCFCNFAAWDRLKRMRMA